MGGLLKCCAEGPDLSTALQSVEGDEWQGGSSCSGRSQMNLHMPQCSVRAATQHLSKGAGTQIAGADPSRCLRPWSLASAALAPSFTCPAEFLFVLFLFKDVQLL